MSPRVEDEEVHIDGVSPGHVALLKQVSKEAAESAVTRMLTMMGLDTEQPIASQENFKVLRDLAKMMGSEDYQRDVAWTRSMRQLTEGIGGKILLTLVGVAVLGAASTMWTGFKEIVRPASHQASSPSYDR